MRKEYRTPELEVVLLEPEESITAKLEDVSNTFGPITDDEEI